MRLSFWIHQLDSNYFPFQWVCGVLRLPDDDTSGQETVHDHSNSKSFDAWPSEEGKEKISHAKRLHDKYYFRSKKSSSSSSSSLSSVSSSIAFCTASLRAMISCLYSSTLL